jgi:hypothetical protein
LIKETDEFKVQAIALAILGMEAFGSSLKCKAKLKEIALTNPSEILEGRESTITKVNTFQHYHSFLVF